MKQQTSAEMGYEFAETVNKPQQRSLTVLAVICIILLLGCLTAFYFVNGQKYQETIALAADRQFAEANTLSGILLPFHADITALRNYIRAGVLMESGAYAEAKKAFTDADGYMDAGQLQKECDFRLGQQLFAQEKYEEAKTLLLSLDSYEEASVWADECSYRIGIGYYEQLRDAVGMGEIYPLAEKAIGEFSRLVYHENGSIMLERTSEYIYSLATNTFDAASLAFNAAEQDGGSDSGATGESNSTESGNEGEGSGDEAAAGQVDAVPQDINGQNYMSLFQDALEYFSLIPEYQESSRYMQVISMTGMPSDVAATILREQMWDFAPARTFLLGRYIPEFFHGNWSGGGYAITFDETYHFSMLSQGSEEILGSGSISTNTPAGWKAAFSFRILGRDSVEVTGKQTYTLIREIPGAEPEGQENTDIPQPEGAA